MSSKVPNKREVGIFFFIYLGEKTWKWDIFFVCVGEKRGGGKNFLKKNEKCNTLIRVLRVCLFSWLHELRTPFFLGGHSITTWTR